MAERLEIRAPLLGAIRVGAGPRLDKPRQRLHVPAEARPRERKRIAESLELTPTCGQQFPLDLEPTRFLTAALRAQRKLLLQSLQCCRALLENSGHSPLRFADLRYSATLVFQLLPGRSRGLLALDHCVLTSLELHGGCCLSPRLDGLRSPCFLHALLLILESPRALLEARTLASQL